MNWTTSGGGGTNSGISNHSSSSGPYYREDYDVQHDAEDQRRATVIVGNNNNNDDDNNSTTSTGSRSSWKDTIKSVTTGGSTFDGFLLAASAEVGQSILTLPWVFSLVGWKAGVALELLFATLALYTNYLLVSMHSQFRHLLRTTQDPRAYDKYYIVSYHDIMEGLVGSWLKYLSLLVVFWALLGLCTVQIIATSSNFYLLDSSRSKREWSYIWGSVFLLVCFIPNFRHYRLMSIFGILTTTYTAWFMTFTSIAISSTANNMDGEEDVYDEQANRSIQDFFNGFVSLLFIYGGHSSNIEVADVMNGQGTKYDKSYFWSYLYVFTLTMPNAVAAYKTFGYEACKSNSNAFALFEPSPYRNFGIVMMTIHQMVAFGLFIGPLFHLWEKILGVHNRKFWIRVLVARFPLAICIVALAIAFPFFGAINSVLGAFTTTFGTYIIPLVGYNLAFLSTPTTPTTTADDPTTTITKQQQQPDTMVKKLPFADYVSPNTIRTINWILVGFFSIAGVGIGGWTSIQNFLKQIHTFEYFAECYQCYQGS